MAELPLGDGAGGVLLCCLRLDRTTREAVGAVEAAVAPVRSLVVVELAGRVLVGFHTRRRSWELPGGEIEPGETPGAAAVRELAEETGLAGIELAPAALAEFAFGTPSRRHHATVFHGVLATAPALVENDELARFDWWDPRAALLDSMSPLDAEVARRCLATTGEEVADSL
jgi:8-oxo-dGTP diphosphatase